MTLGLLVSACSPSPRFVKPTTVFPAFSGDSLRWKIASTAKSYLGTPYRMGGTTRQGVDCSGLIVVVYRQFGLKLPRTAAAQAAAGRPVQKGELEPGDLVFFSRHPGGRVSHVGIYLGKGSFIHASPSAARVRVDSLENEYFRRRYKGARRVAPSRSRG